MILSAGYHDVPPGHIAAVVTHLEMTSPAPLRGVPLPEGLSFDTLVPETEPYRALFRDIGKDWLWFSRLRLSDAELSAILSDPGVRVYTLGKAGKPEALLELDFRVAGECELAYFGLTPELIGTGAGAYLMDRAIELAWSQDIKRLHVHTCTLDSPAAPGFYERSGFVACRRQVEIAPDPRQSGILPPEAAPHIPIL